MRWSKEKVAMRIDPKTTIAGQPTVRVRDFLRRHTLDARENLTVCAPIE